MHLRFMFPPTFLCLALLTLQAVRGEPPTAKTGVASRVDSAKRTDRYGDPLPPGAVARLGTERLTLADSRSELTFSPDGRRLAAYDFADQLRIWDVSSGKELLHIKERPSRWHDRLVYSPDGKTLAMGYGDRAAGTGKVGVWEAATGKELHRLGGRLGQKMPRSIRFSPDGRFLFAGGHGRPILCWDLAGGGKPRKIGNFSSAPFVALSRDGKTVTVGCTDASDGRKWTFVRWDTARGKELGRHALTLAGKWPIELSPEGGILAKPEEDGKSITLLDPLTGRELSRAKGSDYPVNIVFSADGAVMSCLSKDRIVHVWDTATGKVRARFKALSTGIDRIALSPDGKRVALTGRADSAIHIWDVAAGRELHSFAGHRDGPLTIAFLKDGKEIATVSRDSAHVSPYVTEWADWSLRRWDIATGVERAVTRSNPKGEVYHTAFSADGRTLALEEGSSNLSLWEVASGRRRGRLPMAKMFVGAAFSPDGRFLAVGEGRESSLTLWDLATGRVGGRSQGDHGQVESLVFSPDGSRLAVAGYSATVLLCDVAALCGKKKMEEIVKIAVPSAEELEGLGAELSGADGARAYRAIRRLGLSGPRGAAFLKARLKGDKSPDQQRIARLIADLDSDEFATREKASAELAKLGVRAEPALRRTLEAKPSAEVRSRLKRLLERLGTPHEPPPSAELVRLRIVEALEANGTKEARKALMGLSKGSTDALLMQEAKASLARLRSRRIQP